MVTNHSNCLCFVSGEFETIRESNKLVQASSFIRCRLQTNCGVIAMKINQNSVSLSSDSWVSGRLEFEEGLAEKLARLSQNIIRFLTKGSEPKIWQTQTRDGEYFWHIYDPKTGKTEDFISEQEVRTWIDQQYYSS